MYTFYAKKLPKVAPTYCTSKLY